MGSLLVGLGYLGIILPFLQDSESEMVSNIQVIPALLGKSQWVNCARKLPTALEHAKPVVICRVMKAIIQCNDGWTTSPAMDYIGEE